MAQLRGIWNWPASSSLWLSLHVLKLALQARKRQTVDRGWSLLAYLTDTQTNVRTHFSIYICRYSLETWQEDLPACTGCSVGCMGGGLASMHRRQDPTDVLQEWDDANTEAAAGKNAGERKNWICVSDCKTGLSTKPTYFFWSYSICVSSTELQ